MRGEANTETKPRSFLLDTEAPALTQYQGSPLQAVGRSKGSLSMEAPGGGGDDHRGTHVTEVGERCWRQLPSSGAKDKMIHPWAGIIKPLSLH